MPKYDPGHSLFRSASAVQAVLASHHLVVWMTLMSAAGRITVHGSDRGRKRDTSPTKQLSQANYSVLVVGVIQAQGGSEHTSRRQILWSPWTLATPATFPG
jgi:hypothetical protein